MNACTKDGDFPDGEDASVPLTLAFAPSRSLRLTTTSSPTNQPTTRSRASPSTTMSPAAASSSSSSTDASTAPSAKVWLVTGCSSGLGREVALAALARGDRVIATARSAAKIEDLKRRGAHTTELDVTWSDELVQTTVAEAAAVYGRIDILLNNAAYVLVGGIEETRYDAVCDGVVCVSVWQR